MNRSQLLSLILVGLAPLAACSNQVGGGPGTGTADSGDPGDKLVDASGVTAPDAGTGSTAKQVSGSLTTSDSWAGEVQINADTTIAAGTVITVSAGATIRVKAAAALNVIGTLTVTGTKTQGATFTALGGAASPWAGIQVQSGGALDFNYAAVEGATTGVTCLSGALKCDMLHTELRLNGLNATIGSTATFKFSTSRNAGGDGIQVTAGADFTVSDSKLTDAGGDHIRMTGAGKLKVEYSSFKTEHCALHIDASTGVTIRNNSFDSVSYGLMLAGAPAGSLINHNNFLTLLSTWLEETGTNGAVDATGNYWGNTTAQLRTPSTVTTGTAGVTAMFTDVGPRVDPNP